MKVKRLDHLVLTVDDIKRAADFYHKVLGMEIIKYGKDDRTALVFGHQKINLHQSGREHEPKAYRVTPGSADLCFITDVPLHKVVKHLNDCSVPILEGPVARIGALGPLNSVYFRDPDRNLVEIANYKDAGLNNTGS